MNQELSCVCLKSSRATTGWFWWLATLTCVYLIRQWDSVSVAHAGKQILWIFADVQPENRVPTGNPPPLISGLVCLVRCRSAARTCASAPWWYPTRTPANQTRSDPQRSSSPWPQTSSISTTPPSKGKKACSSVSKLWKGYLVIRSLCSTLWLLKHRTHNGHNQP